jgi:dTDP-4-dehydrorhamnose reductase
VILLFGAGGQVGRALRDALPQFGDLTAFNRAQADFGDPDSLRAIVRAIRPNIIVNAAAYTAVDRAESEPEVAQRINADAPKILAQEAEALGAILVHYSTDYVFDGKSTAPYRETDAPAPLSVYGRTKLSGEQSVAAHCRRHLIFRTSWVMSPHGQNFLTTILRLAQERTSLNIVNDQVGAPTSAALIAKMTLHALTLMHNAPAADTRWGLYHLTAGGDTSRHGYARHVVEKAQALGMQFATKPDAIHPITSAEYPQPAQRPANSRLDTSKIRGLLSLAIPHWTDGVDDTLRQVIANQTHDRREQTDSMSR